MRKTVSSLTLILAIGAAPAMARGIQKADPIARLRLSQDVPTDTENYRFIISTKYALEAKDGQSVTAWRFDHMGYRYVAGSIAVGTEIKIDAFKRRGIANYFRVPYAQIQPSGSNQGLTPEWAWVSGFNIAVVAK